MHHRGIIHVHLCAIFAQPVALLLRGAMPFFQRGFRPLDRLASLERVRRLALQFLRCLAQLDLLLLGLGQAIFQRRLLGLQRFPLLHRRGMVRLQPSLLIPQAVALLLGSEVALLQRDLGALNGVGAFGCRHDPVFQLGLHAGERCLLTDSGGALLLQLQAEMAQLVALLLRDGVALLKRCLGLEQAFRLAGDRRDLLFELGLDLLERLQAAFGFFRLLFGGLPGAAQRLLLLLQPGDAGKALLIVLGNGAKGVRTRVEFLQQRVERGPIAFLLPSRRP